MARPDGLDPHGHPARPGSRSTVRKRKWEPDEAQPWRLQDADLRSYMLLGVRHIYRSAINRSRGCLPYVRFNSPRNPPGLDTSTGVHPTWWDASWMRWLSVPRSWICPPTARPWKGCSGCCTSRSTIPPGWPLTPCPARTASGRPPCTSREVLLGLLGLRRWQGSEPSIQLARRFVRRLEEVTRATGSFPSDRYSEKGWIPSPTRKLNQTSGRLIGALVKYFRATRDSLAVDLAVRFAEANIEACFTSKGELTPEAGEHLHSSEGTMTSLIDLGLLTGEQRYLNMGRLLYDVGLRRWRTSWGWAKESRKDQPGRGEANNTGDFVEAALLLGGSGLPHYFQDAERMIRNGLLAAQVVTTDWIPQSSLSDTGDYAYAKIRDRARGAFAFTLPNAYHSYNTDLMGGALQSLAEAYQASVVRTGGIGRVGEPAVQHRHGLAPGAFGGASVRPAAIGGAAGGAGEGSTAGLDPGGNGAGAGDRQSRRDPTGGSRPRPGAFGQGVQGYSHLRSTWSPDPGAGSRIPGPLRSGMERRYHRGHGTRAFPAHRSLLTKPAFRIGRTGRGERI